jgi:hypothetical protein
MNYLSDFVRLANSIDIAPCNRMFLAEDYGIHGPCFSLEGGDSGSVPPGTLDLDDFS